MWHTKYASAVPKNLGVGVNFRPCSVDNSYFLSGRPQSVLLAQYSKNFEFLSSQRGIQNFFEFLVFFSIFFQIFNLLAYYLNFFDFLSSQRIIQNVLIFCHPCLFFIFFSFSILLAHYSKNLQVFVLLVFFSIFHPPSTLF